MITRQVPRCPGSGACGDAASGSNQGRSRTSAEILRHSQAVGIAGVLGQIAAVSEHAFELLQELQAESAAIDQRLGTVRGRIENISDLLNGGQASNGTTTIDSKRGNTFKDNESAPTAYRSSSAMPASIQSIYKACEPPPPLYKLDRFYNLAHANAETPTTPVIGIAAKKYSDPEFVVNDWIKRDRQRREKARQQKEARRRVDGIDQRRVPLIPESTASSTSSSQDVVDQKLRFLKIRSWKEVYGTGEGKELSKQQQPHERSSNFLELRRRSRKSFSSATSEVLGEDGQVSSPSPVAPSPASKSKKRDEGSNPSKTAAIPPPPPPPPPLPETPRGAFMQEMDDDELESEMNAFDNNMVRSECASTQNENGGDLDGFADHGLSYYHDPHNCVAVVAPYYPPPPPPPLLPESEPGFQDIDRDEGDGEFVDCVDIDLNDDKTDGLHPPPLPPPPPTVEIEDCSRSNLEESPNSNLDCDSTPTNTSTDNNFMSEIRMGVSLRRVQQNNPPPSPSTSSLLQQILEKQRNLRAVDPRQTLQHRNANSKAYGPGAVFGNSIARILERGSAMAYESDSAESDNDDEW